MTSYSPPISPSFSQMLSSPGFQNDGILGALAASRYVGATLSGAPVAGTFAVGDYVVARDGRFWLCTVAGSPGVWVDPGGLAGVTTLDSATIDFTGLGTAASPLTADYIGAAGGSLVIVKDADQTVNNSVALQSDTELLFPIGANETWVFEINLRIEGSGNIADIQTALAIPAGATLFANSYGMPIAVSSAPPQNTQWLGLMNASDAPVAGGVRGTNVWTPLTIEGAITAAAAAGNVVLRWAQNTADPTDTVVKAMSYLIATQQ